ncbi:neo-calmodulin-like [Mizuhopecten yessoensis]|uniref:Calmodulin n=1 Tax=Mizuhopecten yessoensis TaxID=6573 RepID=A0A210PL25_MIZYE|nr:neo-calmodulin-like [Mizuhopecten yessoensis]OWF37198.1 Calmodulin [Mizuhopecten yessoensis]
MTAKQEMMNEIDDMRETFALLDTDGTGSISIQRMGLVIRALGHYPTEAQIKDLQKVAKESDTNGNDLIEFPEFLSLYTSFKKLIPENLNHFKEIRAAFQLFDQDGDEVISVDQFRRILANCGEKLQKHEVDDILKDADVDGDGFINYEEFTKTLVGRI